ncbi:putative nuclease HARBI1 [Temnothorax longispinosus]|uniref:putative nuclease HARBI1 n=1 Tax=Temnothorax longispinosus TaxID=300112 RepID=UPI003A99CA87
MDDATMNDALSTITSLLLINSNDNEISSSESSDSENEDKDEDILFNSEMEILYTVLMVNETRGEMVFVEKLTDYVERVIPGYSKTIFKEHFRMFPATFEMVLGVIGPGLRAINNNIPYGRKRISEKKQLLIAIWFMATPDSYRSVATKFGVGRATAFRALRRVTYALHCVAPRFIRWPRDQIALNVMERFQRSCGFPNIVGAIDGTHIKIRAPVEDANSYINRKGFHSMNVQVVCDSQGLFTHCYAGQPGSVHDARVFRNSPVARFLEFPEEYFPNDSHIIGDAAYGIHPHIMVPFRNNGHLTIRQTNFNFCLSSSRMAVERAIGQLKICFRILLDCLPLIDIKKIPEFIIACCVLHNICILQNDEMLIGVCEHDNEINPVVHGNAVN